MKKTTLIALLVAGSILTSPHNLFAQGKKLKMEPNKDKGEFSLSLETGWNLKAPTEIDGEDNRVFQPYGQFECGPALTYKRKRKNKKMCYGAQVSYDIINNDLNTRGFVGMFYLRFGGKLAGNENEVAIGIRPMLVHWKCVKLLGFVEAEKIQLGLNSGITLDVDILCKKDGENEVHFFE